MALGFPTNPYIGETYAFGTKVYIWNGHGWAISNTQGTTVGSFTATQAASITTSTNSTSTNSGALTVTGGVGVGGNTNIGGSLNVGSSTATVGGAQIITTGTIGQIIQAGTDTAIITGTNSVIVSNTSTLQSITGRGGSTTNPISFLNTSTSSVTVAGGFVAQGGISAQSPISVTSTASSTSTTTGALTVAGGVGISGDTNIGGTVTAQQLKIADAILDSTLVLVNTTATTVIDTYLITQYRSSKYLVQIEEVGIGALAKFQVIEILLLLDNSGTVYATEYGTLTSNGIMGDFSAGLDITDSTVKLYFTPYEATNKEIVVLRTALAM